MLSRLGSLEVVDSMLGYIREILIREFGVVDRYRGVGAEN
jgi:hypothetical protein